MYYDLYVNSDISFYQHRLRFPLESSVSARGSSEEEIISFPLTSWIKVKWYEYVLTPSDHSLLLPELHSQGQKHKQIEEQQMKSAILKYLRI